MCRIIFGGPKKIKWNIMCFWVMLPVYCVLPVHTENCTLMQVSDSVWPLSHLWRLHILLRSFCPLYRSYMTIKSTQNKTIKKERPCDCSHTHTHTHTHTRTAYCLQVNLLKQRRHKALKRVYTFVLTEEITGDKHNSQCYGSNQSLSGNITKSHDLSLIPHD